MNATTDRANHAYNQGRPGWYVVNHETQIAVAGPFRYETQANDKVLTINGRYAGNDPRPDALRVYEVTEALA